MELGHTYIHAEFRELLPSRFDALAARLEQQVVNLTQDVFGAGVKVEYLLEEGTLREWVKVWGPTLLIVLGGISQYHDLRESIVDLYQDAAHFGGAAIEQFYKITNTKSSGTIYQRTVPSDIHRLYRIVENTDYLLSGPAKSRDAAWVRDRIISDLAGFSRSNPDDDGLSVFMNALPRDKLPKLPASPDEAVALDERIRSRKERSALRKEPPVFGGVGRQRRTRRRYQHITQL